MRKLLNTLFVTDEQAYLSLEGETIICKSENKEKLRLPFANIENIVCFSYLGCSPALMGKCSECGVGLTFLAPSGRFLARVSGKVKGNVYTRVQQIEVFKSRQLELIRNTVSAKLLNTRCLIERSLRDNTLTNEEAVKSLSDKLRNEVTVVQQCEDIDVIRGIEGNCAKGYFHIFNDLLLSKSGVFSLRERTKHPPLDATNALLSFLYAMLTNDIVSALETVGLDSYIGFYHTLRSGRASLACDLVEELRCTAERFAISMINLKMLSSSDFERQVTGAVYLNDEGRKKVLTRLQSKKREEIYHNILKQKVQYGLLPFVQANLLAKMVRGELNEYPPFLIR